MGLCKACEPVDGVDGVDERTMVGKRTLRASVLGYYRELGLQSTTDCAYGQLVDRRWAAYKLPRELSSSRRGRAKESQGGSML